MKGTGIAVSALVAGLAGAPAAGQGRLPESRPPEVTETAIDLGTEGSLRYAVSLPAGYEAAADDARPLVLALHPGGRGEYYGGSFMQATVEPALRSLGAVMIAPDVPDRSWSTPRSERAVLALLEHVFDRYRIDRARVLVTGYSMGGRGTWYMAARHPDVFTGAIVMAGAPGEGDLELLSDTPLYLIHSPSDEVMPFAPVEEAYLTLSERGHPIEMRVIPGAGHYLMGAYGPALRLAGAWMLDRWDAERSVPGTATIR